MSTETVSVDDTGDIGFRLVEESPNYIQFQEIKGHYVGVQIRAESKYISDLVIKNTFSDCLAIWKGGVTIDNLYCEDTEDYEYSDANHKDLVQAYHLSTSTYKHLKTPLNGLTINQFRGFVRGEGKNYFMFSEIMGYENVRLFARGCDLDTDNNMPYLISATNAVNWEIGSIEHPLDPKRICNKAIRIGGIKEGAPPSKNIVIHAYPGLKLVLDESAAAATTVIEYKRK